MQEEQNATEKNVFLPAEQSQRSKNKYTWKSILAQYLASQGVWFSSLNIGLMLSFPTLALGELYQSEKKLSLNNEEATWFGSLLYLFQPPCSILGGIIQPYMGNRYSLILTFMPQIVAWIMLYFAESVFTLYLAVIFFGISAGSMEAPCSAYIGEISEPRFRSMLCCLMNLGYCFGCLLLFFLGNFYNWRITAAISVAFPIMGAAYIYWVPESPIWLLKKGRKKEALKALRRLRGWVSSECVAFELEQMSRYVETSKISDFKECSTKNFNNSNLSSKWKNQISILSSSAVWKPLLIISMGHFSYLSACLVGIKSYWIDVFRKLRVPIEPNLFVFINTVLMIVGSITCVTVVKFVGKRRLLLGTLMACSLISIILGGYAFYIDAINLEWLPLVAICLQNLLSTAGPNPIPWMLTAEVFPLEARSLGAGLAASMFYVIGFALSKTFYSLEKIIDLAGCIWFYGICGLISCLYFYFYLPETEGKTLAEIEEYFSAPQKKLEKLSQLEKNGLP